MRKKSKVVSELEAISHILDENRAVLDLIYQDLGPYRRSDTGRPGLSAEQVLRCAILKQYRELTYEELAFHLEDSKSFRTFSRLQEGQYPSESTLQENIKAVNAETWEAINQVLIQYAAEMQACTPSFCVTFTPEAKAHKARFQPPYTGAKRMERAGA